MNLQLWATLKGEDSLILWEEDVASNMLVQFTYTKILEKDPRQRRDLGYTVGKVDQKVRKAS